MALINIVIPGGERVISPRFVAQNLVARLMQWFVRSHVWFVDPSWQLNSYNFIIIIIGMYI